MGFNENSNAMMVKIDHTSRDISGYSSLQVYLRYLKYTFDDGDSGIRDEIEGEWDTNHRDQPNGQLAFVENYLQERYGFRVTATPYDAERYRRKPTDAQRESLRSYPFYRHTVTRGNGGLFPWTWERTEVFPFNEIVPHPVSFDVFGFESRWEFNGGATRSMAESDLDSAPAQWVGRPPMFVFLRPRRDGIIITVDVVDLAVGSDTVVATLEDHWGGNFFGTDEDSHLQPARGPLQR